MVIVLDELFFIVYPYKDVVTLLALFVYFPLDKYPYGVYNKRVNKRKDGD